MFWITAVVVVALTSVIVITRAVMLGQVADAANQAVEQEIEEFRHFAAEGTDPETADPFASPARLVEVYLSRQIPDTRESHLGLINGRLLQMDTSALSGDFPAPLSPQEPLLTEILDSAESAGITRDAERGPTHWGRVAVDFRARKQVLGAGPGGQQAEQGSRKQDAERSSHQLPLRCVAASAFFFIR